MGAGPTREGEESVLREPVDFLSVSHINHIAKRSVNTGDLCPRHSVHDVVAVAGCDWLFADDVIPGQKESKRPLFGGM